MPRNQRRKLTLVPKPVDWNAAVDALASADIVLAKIQQRVRTRLLALPEERDAEWQRTLLRWLPDITQFSHEAKE